MNNIRLTLLAAAAIGAATFGSASAMPFGSGLTAPGDSLVQNVRVVCDQNGRCYETRRSHREPRAYYAPRAYDRPYHGYYGTRDDGYYHRGPHLGIGIGPFGLGLNAY